MDPGEREKKKNDQFGPHYSRGGRKSSTLNKKVPLKKKLKCSNHIAIPFAPGEEKRRYLFYQQKKREGPVLFHLRVSLPSSKKWGGGSAKTSNSNWEGIGGGPGPPLI